MTLEAIVDYFETLTRESVSQVPRYYSPEASFKDPFNEVEGQEEIARIYRHMFDQLEQPRFVITGRWERAGGAMLAWDFSFRMKTVGRGKTQCIRGVTQLEFADDGRIRLHRDYWDAAEELYEKLPLVGALMRFMKRRAAGRG